MISALWALTDHAINVIGSKDIAVIWWGQNAPRADKPYITLSYSLSDIPNFDWADQVDAPGWRKFWSWRKAVVDLQVYCGQESFSIANFVAMAFSSEQSLLKQNELNAAIGNRLFLQRVPAQLNNSQWEDRAIYQFDFSYTETFDEWVSWIGAVELTGKTTGGLSDPPPGEEGDGSNECKEIILVEHSFTNWDAFTTPWDAGQTVWDYNDGQ